MLKALYAVLPLLLSSLPTAAQNVQANILTGGASGTYIQIGRDISAVAQTSGVSLVVNESKGSLENLYGVYKRPQTQFGIVQSDVLDFVRNLRGNDREFNLIVERARIIMPLYNEEIHVVAKPGLTSVEDLATARVSVGPQDSGTQLTASFVLDAVQVQPREVISAAPTESLELFLNDQIDAFFYVGGAPLKLLEDPRLTPENARLLPMNDETLGSYYVSATIPGGTYGFSPEDYEGIAVKAVLMTYNFSRNNSAYFRQSCDIVTNVTSAILSNFEMLQRDGHAKWASVDLEDVPPGWQKDDCVKRAEAAAEAGQRAFTNPTDCAAIANPITRNLCLVQTGQ